MTRDELVRRLRENGDLVAAHCAAPAPELERSYAPGKWTIRQILAHLADCELISYWRFGRAVAEPGSNVEPFEQDAWAAGLNYGARPAELSREIFLAARRALAHHAASLPEERLATVSRHPEKGTLSGLQWAELALGHAEHHLGQIEAARKGVPWVKVESAYTRLFTADR